MKNTTYILILAVIVLLAAGYYYYSVISESDPDSDVCIPATRENGGFDVSCYMVPPEGCGVINFQDSGLIFLHSVEDMGDDYVYNVLYDMNCDLVVDGLDVDLCWENRD